MTNALVRHSTAFGCASLVALGLFWMMTSMVNRDAGYLNAERQRMVMNFIRIEDVPPPIPERKRKPPKPPEQEPLPQLEAVSTPAPQMNAPRTPQMNLSRPHFSPNLAMAGLPTMASGMMAYSQPLTPVSQVPPMYPRRALMDGTTGWVKLAFVITEDGNVRDVRVIEASPRRGIFDHEASRALSRWKFHPQKIDGHTVAAHATITINFNLER